MEQILCGQSPSVKKTNKLCFGHLSFLWSRRACSVPLLTLPLGLTIILKNPCIIACDHVNKGILPIGNFVNKLKTLDFFILTVMLRTIPVEDFQRCYQKFEQGLHRCVAAQGNYFEGYNIDV